MVDNMVIFEVAQVELLLAIHGVSQFRQE